MSIRQCIRLLYYAQQNTVYIMDFTGLPFEHTKKTANQKEFFLKKNDVGKRMCECFFFLYIHRKKSLMTMKFGTTHQDKWSKLLTNWPTTIIFIFVFVAMKHLCVLFFVVSISLHAIWFYFIMPYLSRIHNHSKEAIWQQ